MIAFVMDAIQRVEVEIDFHAALDHVYQRVEAGKGRII